MTHYWKTDWFIGLVVALSFLLISGTDWIQQIDWRAYDLGVRFSSARPANPDVVVVTIDDKSLQTLGAWPWPRDMLAEAVTGIAAAKPAVIGLALPFDTRQSTPGLEYIESLRSLLKKNWNKTSDSVKRVIRKAETRLNTDQVLADSLKRAGPVVLALPFRVDPALGGAETVELNRYLSNLSLQSVGGAPDTAPGLLDRWRNDRVPSADIIYPPLPEFLRYSNGLGHFPSVGNGQVNGRLEPLVVEYNAHYFPSFSLALATLGQGLRIKNISVELGEAVRVAHKVVPSDKRLQVYPYFYPRRDHRSAFNEYPIEDVLERKIPSRAFRDKTVIIGLVASQLVTPMDTPVGKISPTMVAAHGVSSLMNNDLYHVPRSASLIKIAVLGFVALYLMFILPRFRIGTGLALSTLLLFALLNVHFILMISQATWWPLAMPMLALVVGHAVLGVKHLLEDRLGRVRLELSEANRMLGVSFQGQGQLDAAFEKYRQCEMDDTLLDQLYNLGLDYERKRQFNKAETVFKYILGFRDKFRDVQERVYRNKEISQSFALGTSSTGNGGSTLVLHTTGVQKPMLGRYQVEKELGRGAMGMVYLGQDPKIGRTVAIKTMSLSQEFEGEKLDEVRARFFREAETAGRLNHPYIVTIYDVGEDQELAYIAMDYLKGDTLLALCKPETLLPAEKVFDIVLKVAEALDYAHEKNVVHRDIKPANIMYDQEGDSVKVTDFGVACLTDASKTKTGTILGSPSYMSPEQLAGKKVDGRSDLFSLTITLYQMLTGELPFIGESLASLMYKIANEKHPDVRMFRPDLPSCVSKIINKGLHKDLERRFQNGQQMANALRRCTERLE